MRREGVSEEETPTPGVLPRPAPGGWPILAHDRAVRGHLRRFAAWAMAERQPDDVARLEPEHVARFPASAEALRRPDGRAKRTGSLNALRSSLRWFFDYLERADLVERSPARVLRMVFPFPVSESAGHGARGSAGCAAWRRRQS